MPKLGLVRWLIVVGLITALMYRKRRRRQAEAAAHERSASESTDAVDEGLKEAIGAIGRLRDLANALRTAVGQIVVQLHRARQSIPPALSHSSAAESQAS